MAVRDRPRCRSPVSVGGLDVARLLVDAGSNPLALDGSRLREEDVGFSALWWAVENGWTKLAAEMRRKWAASSNGDRSLHGFKPKGVFPHPAEARWIQQAALAEVKDSP